MIHAGITNKIITTKNNLQLCEINLKKTPKTEGQGKSPFVFVNITINFGRAFKPFCATARHQSTFTYVSSDRVIKPQHLSCFPQPGEYLAFSIPIKGNRDTQHLSGLARESHSSALAGTGITWTWERWDPPGAFGHGGCSWGIVKTLCLIPPRSTRTWARYKPRSLVLTKPHGLNLRSANQFSAGCCRYKQLGVTNCRW